MEYKSPSMCFHVLYQFHSPWRHGALCHAAAAAPGQDAWPENPMDIPWKMNEQSHDVHIYIYLYLYIYIYTYICIYAVYRWFSKWDLHFEHLFQCHSYIVVYQRVTDRWVLPVKKENTQHHLGTLPLTIASPDGIQQAFFLVIWYNLLNQFTPKTPEDHGDPSMKKI